MNKYTAAPWYWSEDDWHGGYFGLLGANDEDVLVPMTQNEGDTGAAWFEFNEDLMDKELLAASPMMYESLNELLAYVNGMRGVMVSYMTDNERARFSNVLDKAQKSLPRRQHG